MAVYSPETNSRPNTPLSIGQLRIALVGVHSGADNQITPKGMSRIIAAVGGSTADTGGVKQTHLGSTATFTDIQGQITLGTAVDSSIFLVIGV